MNEQRATRFKLWMGLKGETTLDIFADTLLTGGMIVGWIAKVNGGVDVGLSDMPMRVDIETEQDGSRKGYVLSQLECQNLPKPYKSTSPTSRSQTIWEKHDKS